MLAAADIAQTLECVRAELPQPVVLLLASDDSLGALLLAHHRQEQSTPRRLRELRRRLRPLREGIPLDVVAVDFNVLLRWFEGESLPAGLIEPLNRLCQGGLLIAAYEGVTVLDLPA